eukprot:10891870-Karenia_brevis.AAC.1
MLHIPKSQRLRALRVARQCYNRMADGDPKWSLLAEAGERLITASLPRGSSAPVEVGERLDLWEAGSIELLLRRIEQQGLAVKRQAARGKKRKQDGQCDPSGPLDVERHTSGARRAAAEGAYRKAVTGLTSDLMRFSPDEDRKHANKLIPRTQRADTAFATPPASSGGTPAMQNESREEFLSTLKGVRYSKLTGPGPTGRRPEHLQDLLGTPRRREVNLLLHSLGRLHAAMGSGMLPGEARWLTRTRLCWQKKKNGQPRPIQMSEVVRSSFGKRYIQKYAKPIRKAMAAEHQWGISVPGACESLSHWRGTVEDMARAGEMEPVVIADLDQ